MKNTKKVKDEISLLRMLATFWITQWSFLENNLGTVTLLFVAILLYQCNCYLLSTSFQTVHINVVSLMFVTSLYGNAHFTVGNSYQFAF